MKRLQTIRAWAERSLGPVGVAGLLLVLVAAALQWWLVEPARRDAASLQALADGAAATSALPDVEPKATPSQQLADFHAGLPRPDSVPQWLGVVERAARSSGLQLASGAYRLDRRPGDSIACYELTLPVNGSYTQIRAFVGNVLAEVPAASLDDLQIRRDSAASPVVQARLRMSLYLSTMGRP